MTESEFLCLRKTVLEEPILKKAWEKAYTELGNNDRMAMTNVWVSCIAPSLYYMEIYNKNLQLFKPPPESDLTRQLDGLIKHYGWSLFRKGLINTIELNHRKNYAYDYNTMQKLEDIPLRVKYYG